MLPSFTWPDIAASCEYFQQKFGFVVDFTYGEQLFYAQVSRDHVKLALRHVDEPVFAGDVREREELVATSITVATAREIEALFTDYQQARVSLQSPLHDEP